MLFALMLFAAMTSASTLPVCSIWPEIVVTPPATHSVTSVAFAGAFEISAFEKKT